MITWEALPQGSAWEAPLADTRSPLTTLLVRFEEPMVIDAAMSASFPLLEARSGDWRAQASVAATLFLGFTADGPLIFDFETFDGWFALPIDVSSGDWGARLEWSHTSAHFADGIRDNGVPIGESGPWSREELRLQGARVLGPARVLAGVGAVTHALPEAEPFSAFVAAELEGPWRVAPYAAAGLRVAQEDGWSPGLTGQLGGRLRAGEQHLRIALAARLGPEDTGKLQPGEERWVGVLFGFDGAQR